ncbi:MAG TPA: sensor domain-containing diguanylate cyclase [Gammaproteobacteria bacterium]|nr:sensor domain-containing diguanylate cyclase [Gammaproteobacteria bacterium]
MHSPPPARDEDLRLATLRRLRVLDRACDARFDRVTRLACIAVGVPCAAISLVDRDRVWYKSARGIALQSLPRHLSFCDTALGIGGPLVVPDAVLDPRFSSLPLVTEAPKLRFYASHPLYAPDGRRIGGVCVADTVPRRIGEAESISLRDLAAIVETELQVGALAQARSELASDLDVARRQVFIDPLTQTWNRAGILEILQREHARARRTKTLVGVAMVDLDNFKDINDSYGHLTGDRVLRTAAERMIEAVRPYDAVGRYGGEEFLIVLVEREASRVASIAERVRANIAQRPVSMDRRTISMSASVGVACSETAVGAQDIHQLLQRADEALYSAKRNGRNQVVFAQ